MGNQTRTSDIWSFHARAKELIKAERDYVLVRKEIISKPCQLKVSMRMIIARQRR